MRLDRQKLFLNLFRNNKIMCTKEGEIISFFKPSPHKLKFTLSTTGYKKTTLCYRNKRHTIFAHQLVWFFFNQEIVSENLQTNHINGIKTDNSIKNLELISASDNILHSYKFLGRSKKGSKHHLAKLTEDIVLKIKVKLSEGVKGIFLAKKYSVSSVCISNIKTGSRWGHVKI